MTPAELKARLEAVRAFAESVLSDLPGEPSVRVHLNLHRANEQLAELALAISNQSRGVTRADGTRYLEITTDLGGGEFVVYHDLPDTKTETEKETETHA